MDKSVKQLTDASKVAEDQAIPTYANSLDIDDAVEAQDASRRHNFYSPAALRVALPIDQIYVNHDRFASGLIAMDRLFQIAKDVRMPHGARLIGPTGSGKSALIRNFGERLPKSNLFAAGHGAIAVRSDARPTAGHLISALLQAYKYPFARVSSKALYIKRANLFDLIHQKGTRLIFVDEADRLLSQVRRRGDSGEHPEATQLLRDMMDECHVAVVLAGTAALDQLGNVDSHLADRLSVRHELQYFEPNQHWLSVLRGFVKESHLFDISLALDGVQAKKLHIATGGSLRRLKRLLTEGALVSAQANMKALDQNSLRQAYELVEGQHRLRSNPYG